MFCVVCVHDTAQVAMRQIALGQEASPHPLRLTEARGWYARRLYITKAAQGNLSLHQGTFY